MGAVPCDSTSGGAVSYCKAVVLGLGVLLWAGSPEPTHAQIIGFKMGPTYSTLQTENISFQTNGSLSFGGAILVRFHLSGPFSVQPELMVVTKGADIDRLIDDDFELELKYLEVPLLLRASTRWGRFHPYVMAGPTISFEYDCEVDAVVDEQGQESDFDCEQIGATDVFERNTTDLGVTGVLGVEYAGWGPGNVLLEARYTHGFTNIADQDSGGLLSTTARNRSGALFVGYAFHVNIF